MRTNQPANRASIDGEARIYFHTFSAQPLELDGTYLLKSAAQEDEQALQKAENEMRAASGERRFLYLDYA